jgi:hypothetical protein
MTTAITKNERLELAKLVRLRAKDAKSDVDTRAAQLLADFETKLAARYPESHEAWADITAEAKRVIEDADAKIAQRCAELGIPPEFRPSLQVSWWSRGENAIKERRVELRRVAQAQLEARAKQAKLDIDRRELTLQTQLAAGALESADAQAFLATIPQADALLTPLELPALGTPVRRYE